MPDNPQNDHERRRPYQLVIVESPSKCRTISKILEHLVTKYDLPFDYCVESCYGHVRNLPRSAAEAAKAAKVANNAMNDTSTTTRSQSLLQPAVVGVNVQDGTYEPTYVILPGKQELVAKLQALAARAQKVLLATDEDREGEAVAWHLAQVLNLETNNDSTSTNNDRITPAAAAAAVPYERVTFTEITPTAIEEAIMRTNNTGTLHDTSSSQSQQHSSLNLNLVRAQETRRILDRLAGYTLSPLLWKKIAPGLSAGRVQSVGMALVVQREVERLEFANAHYWDMIAELVDVLGGGSYNDDVHTDGNSVHKDDTDASSMATRINATLTAVQGVPVATGSDFNNQGQLVSTNKRHLSEEHVEELKVTLQDKKSTTWTVVDVSSRQRQQYPPMPFTTSTLQQEANKRLGISVSQCMSKAQALYEGGFISYMRTDSTTLSKDAQRVAADIVTNNYGSDLIETSPRKGRKSKNAQEAHEAIRPAIQSTGSFLQPTELPKSIDEVGQKLYQLIYGRTLASRMVPQVLNQTSVTIEAVNGEMNATFRVSGSVVVVPGYTLALGKTSSSSSDSLLPPLEEGQVLDCSDLYCLSHSTQPPPRYTEASFVKELEARGVGRPSTYAGTVQILRDRAYVGTPVRASDDARPRRNTKARTGSAISAQRAAGGEEFTGGGRGPLVPSLSAFVVYSLLEKHCATYVDPGFTASMEERLDQIARGEEGAERVAYLDEFYAGTDGLAAKVKRIDETVAPDEARRAALPALFLNNTDETDEIGLFIGPWGPYVKKMSSRNDTDAPDEPLTVNLPAGMATDLSTITLQALRTLLSSRETNGELMGMHPDDGRAVRLKLGPYGAYLQWGDDGEDGTTTHSLPKHLGKVRPADRGAVEEKLASLSNMIGLTFEEAVGYVGLPRVVCTLNDLPVIASIGPYGSYLKYNNSFVSLTKKDGDVLTVDAKTAERVVTDGIISKNKMGRGVIAELGEKDGGMVRIKDGRFGVYVNWKKVNSKLPTEYTDCPETLPLDEAWSLILEKSDNGIVGEAKPSSASPQIDLPPAPKRPKSAYLHFCAEKRPQVSENVKSLGEVSKELARMWANTTDREPYERLAAADKEAYKEKKGEWQKKCQLLLINSSSTKKRGTSNLKAAASRTNVTSSLLPKRPKTAYLYFCADKRPEVSQKTKSLGDISKELAKLWAKTADNEQERKKYQDMANADKKRYEQALMERNQGIVYGTKKPKQKSTPKKKTASKKASPRAASAYMMFCSEFRKTIVDEHGERLPFGETTKRLAQMWKECDDETRSHFQDKAAKAKKKLLQAI